MHLHLLSHMVTYYIVPLPAPYNIMQCRGTICPYRPPYVWSQGGRPIPLPTWGGAPLAMICRGCWHRRCLTCAFLKRFLFLNLFLGNQNFWGNFFGGKIFLGNFLYLKRIQEWCDMRLYSILFEGEDKGLSFVTANKLVTAIHYSY